MVPPEDVEGWRHIRLKLTGPNASGQTHYLSLSGLELYGEIRGLADEELGRGGSLVNMVTAVFIASVVLVQCCRYRVAMK